MIYTKAGVTPLSPRRSKRQSAILLGLWLLGGAWASGDGASEEAKIPMAGVVSYTDWSHVFLKDPRVANTDLLERTGTNAIRQIVDTAEQGGMTRLYWRTAGSAGAYYLSAIDSDGDGEVDIETVSSYHFDNPAYRPIYRIEALTPDHLKFAVAEDGKEAVVQALGDFKGPLGVRLHARISAGEDRPVYLYIATEGESTRLYPLHATKEAHGKFRTYRAANRMLEVEGEVAAAEVREAFPLAAGNEVGLYWPAGSTAEVAVNGLEVVSLARLERDRDALPDLLDLDLGPVVKGLRDEAWEKVVKAENVQVQPIMGDPKRRDDFARTYRSPHNPFGPGEDQISSAVKEARARGMKIYLWFTLGEENHYGSGPMSAFVRKHPDWREVDKDGNVWQGRLSLAIEGVRKYKVALVKEAVERYAPDGVLIDFVRRGLRDPYLTSGKEVHYPVRDEEGISIFGYDAVNLAAFAGAYPDLPVPKDNQDPRWVKWRVETHTRLMQELKAAVAPVPVAVAVFSGSAEATRQGDLLDWQKWAREGLVQEIMFMLDNSEDGRPFVRPFGSPPKPIESVGTLISARRAELPEGFPISAGIYCYKIDSNTIPSLVDQARKAGATEIAWWETTSLEWTEGYSGKAWKEIRALAAPLLSSKPATSQR